MGIRKLVCALQEAMRTEREEHDAHELYEGHDWGYYGFMWRDSSDKARKEFAVKLNEYIDARVRAILSKAGK